MKNMIAALLLAACAPAVAAKPAADLDRKAETEAKNKALVLEFWAKVFDGRDVSKARDYLAEDLIQHNPAVPGGLKGFVEYFSKGWTGDRPAGATDFAEVLADGDLVQLVIRRRQPMPSDPSKSYEIFWFDLYRVKDGRIVEHWDPARLRAP